MKTIRLEVVSAEEQILVAEGIIVVIPGEEGELGITPGHSPLITRLKSGEIRLVREDGEENIYFVSSGYAEVLPSQVSVLADTVLRAEEIDERKARVALNHARSILDRGVIGIDYAEAKAELARATAQLRVLEDYRQRRR